MLPIGRIAWPSGHSTLSWNDDNEEDTEDVQFDFPPKCMYRLWISTFARSNGTELELEGIFFSRHEILRFGTHLFSTGTHLSVDFDFLFEWTQNFFFFLIRQCFDWTLFFRILEFYLTVY